MKNKNEKNFEENQERRDIFQNNQEIQVIETQ